MSRTRTEVTTSYTRRRESSELDPSTDEQEEYIDPTAIDDDDFQFLSDFRSPESSEETDGVNEEHTDDEGQNETEDEHLAKDGSKRGRTWKRVSIVDESVLDNSGETSSRNRQSQEKGTEDQSGSEHTRRGRLPSENPEPEDEPSKESDDDDDGRRSDGDDEQVDPESEGEQVSEVEIAERVNPSKVKFQLDQNPSKEVADKGRSVQGVSSSSGVRRIKSGKTSKISPMFGANGMPNLNASRGVVPQESKQYSDMPLFKSSSTRSTVKLDKQGRKAARKLSKMMAVVANQMGAERSPLPTEWIVMWGAGLGLGTPKSTLMEFFKPPPVDIRYYVGKPFCAAKFASVEDATNARENKTGTEVLPSQPLYIGYLGEEPPAEDLSVLEVFRKKWPVGLNLIPDFITEQEEQALLDHFYPDQFVKPSVRGQKRDILADIKKAQRLKAGGVLKNRSVQHFGYEFRYGTNDVDVERPMKDKLPDLLVPFFVRMMTHSVLFRKPEQLTLNHYLPGQGIPPHVDTHSCFEETIISLSLAAPVVMDFRESGELVSVLLPRRSLLVLNDEARYLWSHGITGRSYDVIEDPVTGGLTAQIRQPRVSLTFRLLNKSRICYCRFPHACDSQRGQFENANAAELEKDLVHTVYESIASHFSSTRHTPWPKVKEFVESLDPFQNMLDVGCGNGKYFNLTDYIYQVGTDMSKGLLEIAQTEKNVDGVRANCLQLPFRDETFEALICIAVLHHLSTKERRIEALREMVRVLAPGGQGLIYVWAKAQRLKEVKSNYARQRSLKAGRDADEKPKYCLHPLRDYSFLPIHDHSDDFLANDLLVPWKSGGRDGSVEHRYYHVFDRGELEGLLHELETPPQITDSYYDQGNWCIRFRKQDPFLYDMMANTKHETICDDD